MPTLLVWGEDDSVTPLEMAACFHAFVPGSRIVVLRDCGHAPMIEQPSAFGYTVRAWLEETWPRN